MKYVKIKLAALLSKWARKLDPTAYRTPPPRPARYERMDVKIMPDPSLKDTYEYAQATDKPATLNRMIKRQLFARLTDGLVQSAEVDKYMYRHTMDRTEVVGLTFYFKLND